MTGWQRMRRWAAARLDPVRRGADPAAEKQDVRQLSDALPVLIGVIDAEHRYEFVNEAYEQLHQQRREELEGRHLKDTPGPVYEGAIESESEVDVGTMIRVLLPSVAPAEAVPPRRERRTPVRWQGEATVLVIDDEPGVRRVARRILGKCGLTVLLAESGREGVAMLESKERIDAVLLDLTMPEMDGAETFHALREKRPGLPIVLCSGYSRDEVRRHFEGDKAPRLVEKPFTPEVIVEAIRSALED